MFTTRLVIAMLLLLLSIPSFSAPQTQGAEVLLQQADRLYAEKTFGAAADTYERAIKTGELSGQRQDEIEYRFDEALGRAERWDRALAEGVAFVQRHRGTLWEARGLYWLGRLYLVVPHQGWVIGGRLTRHYNLLTTNNSVRPVDHWMGDEDRRNALDAFEAARTLFPTYRSIGPEVMREEVQLDFDLIRMLGQDVSLSEWANSKAWDPLKPPDWQIDLQVAYSIAWSVPKKVMYLFQSAAELAGNDRRQAALALLGKAMWLHEYQQLMHTWALIFKDGKYQSIPYPYDNVTPISVLQELLRDPRYADDTVRDLASLTMAAYLAQDNRITEADSELVRLLFDRPGSALASTVRTHLDAVRHTEVSVGPMEVAQLPGVPPHVHVAYRNAGRIRMRVFKLPLQDLYQHRITSAMYLDFMFKVQTLLGPKYDASQNGPALATWEFEPEHSGEREPHQQTVTLPVMAAGAYLVEASASGVSADNIVIVSDLALVRKAHRDGVLFFAANAQTGAPEPGVHVVTLQSWASSNAFARSSGVTGPDGLVTIPYTHPPTEWNVHVWSFAYRGDSYALESDRTSFEGIATRDAQQRFTVYGITDRAVYRPGQQVHYRLVVMHKVGSGLKPAAGMRVVVTVRDPNRNELLKRTATSGPFGTVHDDLNLPPEAAIGEYYASVAVVSQPGETQPFQFQVEEYKKPEFEVTVKPVEEHVRFGESGTVLIRARYYFGGPVPNAHVKYRVFRDDAWRGYRFPRAYDTLYNDSYRFSPYRRVHSGPPAEQGEARTDARGVATITFVTVDSGRSDSDYRSADYTVEAEVQDASRRVIAGVGTVQAVHRALSVDLQPSRGYYHVGDLVQTDIADIDVSNRPVPSVGAVTILSDPYGPKQLHQEILRQPFRTGADGKGLFTWRPAKVGFYQIRFLTHDAYGGEVSGATNIWVVGPDLMPTGSYERRSVEVIPEEAYYTEGRTARVLLMTPAFDCTVLLTREAGSVILEKRLLRVPGCYMQIDLPIRRSDVPGITVAAVLVSARDAYWTSARIRVPPVRQIASVSVQSDRSHYKPGETATVHLAARDYRGRPLRAELSLGITDASLDYIHADTVQDIRRALINYFGYVEGPDTSFHTRFDELVDNGLPEAFSNLEWWSLPPGMGRIDEWPDAERVSLDLFPGDRSLQNGDIEQAQSPYNSFRWISYWGGGFGGGMGGLGGGMNGNGPIYGRGGQNNLEAVQVRRLFADTALWAPAIVTDAHGTATVRIRWPDNLTRWRARAVAVGAGGEVGTTDASIETKKDLLVRLSAPRFAVERDVLMLSATVQNALPHAAQVRVRLKLGSAVAELVKNDPTTEPGAESTRLEKTSDLRARMPVRRTVVLSRQGFSTPGAASASPAEIVIDVPAEGEKRVDWTVRARRPGRLPVTVTALSAAGSDAMEVSLPVLIHGAERVVTRAGVLRGQNPHGQGLRDQNRVDLPIQVMGDRTDPNAEVVVHLQPSLAVVALDALPYLIDDPYGCVEQTMSRFLPAVVVRKTLNDLGYNLDALRRRAAALPQQRSRPRVRRMPNSPYTAPLVRLGSAVSPPATLFGERAANPVFSSARLHAVVTASLKRLRAMQHADGGWGWWTHDDTDSYMTAYVVYGLLMARDAGIAVDSGLLSRGLGALMSTVAGEKDPQRLALEVRVLAMDPKSRDRVRAIATGRLFATREKLSIYSKALLAQALHDLAHDAEAGTVLRNIEDAARVDAAAGTATWDENGEWWRWYDDSIETHAAVLQAYLAIQPTHRLVPMIARWLTNEREDVRWSSTKETALAILALVQYARANREFASDYTVTVSCGRIHRLFRVTHDTALFFSGRLTLSGATLHTGDRLKITKRGPGTLYYTVSSRSFSQAEPLQPVSGDLAVERRYFRLIPTASARVSIAPIDRTSLDRPNPFLTGRYDLALDAGDSPPESDDSVGYRREPLAEGDAVASGDLIEVALQLTSRQDFEYLVFEDIKPAGCEPIDLQSGEQWEPGVYSNRELRDQKVAFFIDDLAAGSRLLTYRLYAEIPGRFHVLPTNGYAMYAPRVRALSGEISLRIR